MVLYPDLRVDGRLRLEWDDGREQWSVLQGITVTWRGGRVVVPAGFETDLSSIPEWARGLIPQVGRHNTPSVVHDWCYATRWRGDRAASDRLFLELMRLHGVPWLRRRLMFAAVRAFGGGEWADDD